VCRRLPKPVLIDFADFAQEISAIVENTILFTAPNLQTRYSPGRRYNDSRIISINRMWRALSPPIVDLNLPALRAFLTLPVLPNLLNLDFQYVADTLLRYKLLNRKVTSRCDLFVSSIIIKIWIATGSLGYKVVPRKNSCF
jgi:hypothetical protein